MDGTCVTDFWISYQTGGVLVSDAALPVSALFASCLQNLIQLFHHHSCIDLSAFSKHLGLFLVD